VLEANSKFGDYLIERALGSGAMGDVYLATDTRLDRKVALKILKSTVIRSAEIRERAEREARAAARIDSPYVVRVWEYSVFGGVPFIAMEYVAGENLSEAAMHLAFEEKLQVALQMSEGVAAAHRIGLIHRDLKPENIRITGDRQVKIFDFGLAKSSRADSVDEDGNIAGTLHYLAPEQLAAEPVTFAADLYSLGAVFYELFVGHKPFEGSYPASVIYSILHEDPPSPREIDSDLPLWLDQLIVRLLAKKPDDRFESAGKVAGLLKDSLSGQPVALDRKVRGRQKHVTIIDLRNLSGDDNWGYFCQGFTENLISEVARRTDLAVSAQPSAELPRDIQAMFQRYRSDFIVSGSLMHWQDRIQLQLTLFGSRGNQVLANNKYEEADAKLFDLLSLAAGNTAEILARHAGEEAIEVTDFFKVDISAYEYYLKGKSYYQTNKPRELEFAVQMFERALQIDPTFALAHSGIADVLVFQYMAYYDRSPRVMKEGREHAQEALKLDPGLPEAHRSLGRFFMFSGDLKAAEACFLRAVDLNPKYAVGYRTLAWLMYQQGEFAKAMQWIKRSLQLSPTDTETLLLLGILHTYERRYTAAMATLQRAVEIGPDYGRAYYNLGLVYLKLGVVDLSLENLTLACKYKGDPNCYVDAGWLHFLKGQLDEARTCYQKSIEKNWMPFIAYYSWGFLEATQGSQSQARDCFAKAVALLEQVDYLNRENVQIEGYFALALAGLGETNKARKVLDHILSAADLIGDVYYNVARAYALLGDKNEAKAYLLLSLSHSPGPTESEISLDPHFREIDLTSIRRGKVA